MTAGVGCKFTVHFSTSFSTISCSTITPAKAVSAAFAKHSFGNYVSERERTRLFQDYKSDLFADGRAGEII
jgi:hypothetical protein